MALNLVNLMKSGVTNNYNKKVNVLFLPFWKDGGTKLIEVVSRSQMAFTPHFRKISSKYAKLVVFYKVKILSFTPIFLRKK